jgi:hypothetical protein
MIKHLHLSYRGLRHLCTRARGTIYNKGVSEAYVSHVHVMRAEVCVERAEPSRVNREACVSWDPLTGSVPLALTRDNCRDKVLSFITKYCSAFVLETRVRVELVKDALEFVVI